MYYSRFGANELEFRYQQEKEQERMKLSYKAKDVLIRGARTFVQAFLGVFISLSASPVLAPDYVPDQGVLKRAALAAAWSAVVALVSFVQNALENYSPMPAVGKPSPPAENPTGIN